MEDPRPGLLAAGLLGDDPALNEPVESRTADPGFLPGRAAVGDVHASPAPGQGVAHDFAGGVRRHDTIGGAAVEQGTDGRDGHRIPVSVGHGRGDIGTGRF
ncbi:hypothetical protein GCM10010266_31570 [Streptomyces griseomycini]|nr:hypothetical protein GCM10010266_31570 [Streptomyces griseomycini]GGR21194.1 hypothetical protein GCM10015536_28520 [Streptomyces griseomycini]